MTKIIGITGGIASGKSTVVEEIRKAGFQIVDADQVVHDLQAKGGKLYQALVAWLGPAILDENGDLNRPKLAEMIFSSPDNLAKSAEIQTEIIRQELLERRKQLEETEEIFFMDIPLLVEQNYVDWFDAIWLVAVKPEVQIQRLMVRNAFSQREAEQRIASQMPLEEKLPFATVVIDNNGALDELKGQVNILIDSLS